MKILLITDYYYPFNPGGTEWSVYELAKGLQKNKIDVKIVTLNYGSKAREIINGIDVIRLPFVKKLRNNRQVVSPILQNNPIFFILSSFHLFKLQKTEKADILHVHGKFLLPATFIASLLTKTPSIVSIRDKQILCSIGRCFYKGNIKSCSPVDYIFKDFPWFYKNYSQSKNPFSFVYVFLGVIWARINFYIIKILAKRFQKVIAISKSQKKYLSKNGFSKVKVIYNTAAFRYPINRSFGGKTFLFAGKLSIGKGADILIKTIEEIEKYGEYRFLFAGNIENKLRKHRSINFLGELSYEQLKRLYSTITAVVMPSIYPEAFGRIPLEALAVGTPAIVTSTGALPEVVDDKKTGRVVKTSSKELLKGLLDIVKHEKKYKKYIRANYKFYENKYYNKPLKDHISLYKSLLK